MKIVLLQPVQNKLYHFSEAKEKLSKAEAIQLQQNMIEQTFELLESAPPADLYVTTEAVNYPGEAQKLPGNYADYIDARPLLERFSCEAAKRHAYIAAGLYEKDATGILRNTLTVFERSGKQAAHYTKVHTVGSEQQTLMAGNEYSVLEADFGRIGLCICWDMQFPEVCRHYALDGCHMVICPTWGWESIYSHARAYENGIWVAGAMSVPYTSAISGIRTPSEVIAPDGSIRALASADHADILLCECDLNSMHDLYSLRMNDRHPETYMKLTTPKVSSPDHSQNY